MTPANIPPGQLLTVHPTQLYEIALTFVVFALLWRWKEHRHAAGWLFGAYLVLSSVERIVAEVFRAKDDRILGPVTVAQLLSIAVIGLGAYLLRRFREPFSGASRSRKRTSLVS